MLLTVFINLRHGYDTSLDCFLAPQRGLFKGLADVSLKRARILHAYQFGSTPFLKKHVLLLSFEAFLNETVKIRRFVYIFSTL